MANSTFKGNISGSTANPSDVTLAAGTNITLTPSGSTLTISAASGGSSFSGLIAYRSTTVTGYNDDDVIKFNTVVIDTASAYNATTGTYTFPTTGYWLISGCVTFSATSSTTTDVISTTLLGSVSSNSTASLAIDNQSTYLLGIGGVTNSTMFTRIASITSGQTLQVAMEFTANLGTAANRTIYGNSGTRTYLTLEYLGT